MDVAEVNRRLIHGYAAVPYEAGPIVWSHPARLGALGVMAGLTPASPERCRVLELGCANGANLLAMALTCPDAELLGLDLSPAQIEEGSRTAAELGAHNLRLEVQDIGTALGSLGEYDYILAHEVFTFVPPAIQADLLEICRRHLAPHGLAYISLDVNPLHKVRQSVHDLLRFLGQGLGGPALPAQVRPLLPSLVERFAGTESLFPFLVRGELERMSQLSLAQLYHQDLPEVHTPLYFHEFYAQLTDHGLA